MSEAVTVRCLRLVARGQTMRCGTQYPEKKWHNDVLRSLFFFRSLMFGAVQGGFPGANFACSSPCEIWGSYRTPVLPATPMHQACYSLLGSGGSIRWFGRCPGGTDFAHILSQYVVRFIKRLSLRRMPYTHVMLITNIVAFDFCLKNLKS